MYNVLKRDFPYFTEFYVYSSDIFDGADLCDVRQRKRSVKLPRSDLGDGFLKCPVSPFDDEDFSGIYFEDDRSDQFQIWNCNKSINRIFDLARCNDWEYFVTLTFNPSVVDSTYYEACSKVLSQWFDALAHKYKRKGVKLSYLVVPELHSDGLKYHFHALMSGIPPDELTFAMYKWRKRKRYKVYNWDSYSFGFTTVVEVYDSQGAAKYLSKYLTKELINSVPKGKKKFWYSRDLLDPVDTKYFVPDDQLQAFMVQLYDNSSFCKRVDFPNVSIRKYIYTVNNGDCCP